MGCLSTKDQQKEKNDLGLSDKEPLKSLIDKKEKNYKEYVETMYKIEHNVNIKGN